MVWLSEYHAASDHVSKWINRRSWIAIVFAGAAIVLTIVNLFVKVVLAAVQTRA
jgi:hypothetical protein